MKNFIILFTFIAVALSVTSCKQKQEPTPTIQEPVVEVYQPVHNGKIVDLAIANRYTYFPAPTGSTAKSVKVDYDNKTPYATPIVITYSYGNGDTYTYTIPNEFGLWENELGRLRVVVDDQNTVWLQGQTKNGKFHEFVFYGDPRFNGKKIKPNSYLNHHYGVIKYAK